MSIYSINYHLAIITNITANNLFDVEVTQSSVDRIRPYFIKTNEYEVLKVSSICIELV